MLFRERTAHVTMSYGGGSYRYSPLSKYASSHGLSGSSHGLSGNSGLHSSYTGLQSNPYVSPYTSPMTGGFGSGLGSGYSSRSGSTSSLSSIGSVGSAGSYPGTISHIPYRVGSIPSLHLNFNILKYFDYFSEKKGIDISGKIRKISQI